MGISEAYNTSGKIFTAVSQRYQPQLADQIRAIEEGDVTVVRGTYDHIEKLLDKIKVPYATINSEEITPSLQTKVLFVNCKEYSSAPETQVVATKKYVENGGRLVSTDWALSLVERAFPGTITKTNSTGGNESVEVEALSMVGQTLIGLNYAQCHPQWFLESGSYVYTHGKNVTPIITSDAMNERYGSPNIAVGFRAGSGEVIHFISHLEAQQTKLKHKSDKEGLDEFLSKMKVEKTDDMEEAKLAELEAAYSTLNTVAHLCVRTPLLGSGDFKSVMAAGSSIAAAGGKKSTVFV